MSTHALCAPVCPSNVWPLTRWPHTRMIFRLCRLHSATGWCRVFRLVNDEQVVALLLFFCFQILYLFIYLFLVVNNHKNQFFNIPLFRTTPKSSLSTYAKVLCPPAARKMLLRAWFRERLKFIERNNICTSLPFLIIIIIIIIILFYFILFFKKKKCAKPASMGNTQRPLEFPRPLRLSTVSCNSTTPSPTRAIKRSCCLHATQKLAWFVFWLLVFPVQFPF